MINIRLATFCLVSLAYMGRPGITEAQDGSVPGYSVPAVLAANVVLGAAIAAMGHIGSRDKAARAAMKGAAGGAVVFAGKWIVSQGGSSTSLVGREVAEVGSSGVRNAAAGDGLLQHVALMYGPIRFHITTGKAFSIQPKVDLASSLELWRAAHTRQLSFDWERSINSGVAMFEVDSAKSITGKDGLGGSHEGGVVRFRAKAPFQIVAPDVLKQIIGHELVHVAQFDFAFNAIAAPVEAEIWKQVPGGKSINRFVDLGLNVPLLSGLNFVVPYKSRPWEREARTLSGR